MKQQSFFSKVAVDMFFVQLKWSLWFICFILTALIIMMIVSINTGSPLGDFLAFSHGSSKIYMLVIGIISAYAFLTFYVNQGITRKDYFIGSSLAAIGVSLAIAIIATVLTGLEYIILEVTNLPIELNRAMVEYGVVSSDNSISIMLPKAIVSSSILVHSSNWLLSMFMYALNILTFYAAGWFIGSGYYRFGWVAGFGFIALAIVFIVIGDLLWGTKIEEPLSNWLPFTSIDLPQYGSFLCAIVLIVIILGSIRLLTRRVTIKM